MKRLIPLIFAAFAALVLPARAVTVSITSTTSWTTMGNAASGGAGVTVSYSGSWTATGTYSYTSVSLGSSTVGQTVYVSSAVAPLVLTVYNGGGTQVATLQLIHPSLGGSGSASLGTFTESVTGWNGTSTGTDASVSGVWTIPGLAAGSYTVQASSGTSWRTDYNAADAGIDRSATATMTTLGNPPTITQQPANLTVKVGNTASFTVAASGDPTLSYQWYQGTPGSGTAISGATGTGASSTYSFTTTLAQNSTYYCVVTNPYGSATSQAATLTVQNTSDKDQTVTLFANNSASVVVAVGSTVQFTANGGNTSYTFNTSADARMSAAGLPTWFTSSSNPGNRVVTVNYTASTAGTWTIYGHAPAGLGWDGLTYNASTNDVPVSITVLAPPLISGQPANQSITYGQDATFTVSASGSSLTYQWYSGTPGSGTAISGQTGASLTVSKPAVSASGSTYYVVVSNAVGSATSNAATLTVAKAPLTITPADATRAYLAANPTFTANYAGFVNGDTSAVLSGLSLSTTATAASDVGTYPITGTGATAANYAISYVSGTLTVTKIAQTAPGSIAPPSIQSGSSFGPSTFAAGSGTRAGTASWYYRTSSGGSWQALSGSVTAGAAGSYLGVQVTYDGGTNYTAATSAEQVITITSSGTAPSITAQPANESITYGQSATFTPSVSGTAPLTYQWYSGTPGSGTVLAGQTGLSLTLTAPAVSASGSTYYVVVSNAHGSATSNAATLTVAKAPLTITPADASRVYLAANPAFTAGYAGFVNGDTSAVVSGLALSTTATAASDVGAYPITGTGATAANYALSYVSGTLTVTKIAQTAPGSITPTSLQAGSSFGPSSFAAGSGTRAGTPSWVYRTSSGGSWQALSGSVSAGAAGSYLGVQVTYDGGTNYTAASSAEQVVSIKGQSQAPVTISPATSSVSAGAQQTFTASGGSGTGAYVWSCSTGSLSATTGGSVAWTAPASTGNATVSVYRAGDGTYADSAPASADVTITTAKLSNTVTISVPSGPIYVGTAVHFAAAQSAPSTGNFAWTGLPTVSTTAPTNGNTQTGPFPDTFNSAGTYSVSVQNLGDTTYAASNVSSASVTVLAAGTPSIAIASLVPSPSGYVAGSSVTMKPSGSPYAQAQLVVTQAWMSGTDTITWISGPTGGLQNSGTTLALNGQVEMFALSATTPRTYTSVASLKFVQPGNYAFKVANNLTGLTSTCTVTVNPPPPPVITLTPTPNPASLDPTTLTAAITVGWTVQNDATLFIPVTIASSPAGSNAPAGAAAGTINNSGNAGTLSGSLAAFSVNKAGTYVVQTTGYDGTVFQASFVVNPPPAAPSITTQPGNQSITYGQTATFTAVVGGSPTPSYQWQVSTNGGASWANVSGAASTTLSLTPPVSSSGGQYRLVATNSQGSAATNAATLTVAPAALTLTPDALSKSVGQADPALTWTAAGYQLGDTAAVVSGALSRAAGETAGSYAIGPGTLAAADYTLSLVPASFTITASTQMISLTPVASSVTVNGRTYSRLWQSGSTWNAYLARSGLQFLATGMASSSVRAFELQARSPAAGAAYTTIATAAPAGANGAGVPVACSFAGLMLDAPTPGNPLVPASYAAGASLAGVWTFRARVQDAGGTWSGYSEEVFVTAGLPIAHVAETLRSHPPAGPEGAWFEASEPKTYTFPLWIP